ncbi:trypsin-like peptidase domain-containing protein [Azospirillum sp. RWY-5-1]|uniref:Trypsin-like peptidase domain-containing protein n=1 Tax=Azospirillum oleiclasticum TaxID=2735135 RepID=A0ABX2T845_9PROT|nr:trypsin-like peptidase domain-containing protein [Azospirillum oleiclasticum]NYZ13080.1 trypsin-like peptidase domain-containing protein [Azospirillum oleiclasticum]NYZ20247.1 trypsin-like peptidase domain-containing protein [Azospirillum oleiclasticum]
MRPVLASLLPVTVLVAACAGMDRPEPAAAVAPVPPGSTEPIRFDDLRLVEMRRGEEVGRYVFGLDCVPPYDVLFWTTGRNLHEQGTYQARFREALTGAGFDVAGAGGGSLDRGTDRKRARFTVSGELRDLRMELCRRVHWLTGASQGESGEGTARVDWSVHRVSDGRLVHRATTIGSAALDHGVPQGRVLLVEEAFLDAALKLAADPAFRNAVARPGAAFGPPADPSAAPPAAPAAAPATTPAIGTAAPPADPSAPMPLVPAAAPDGPGILLTPAPSGTRVAARGETLTEAILQVGHGRGVVVGTADGGSLVLATTAAAGRDDQVSVHPARGVILDGTVERRDGLAELVLLRVPARLTALPLRTDPPAVSERVRVAVTGGTALTPGIVARLEPGAGAGDASDLGYADLAGARVTAGDPVLDEAGRLIGVTLPVPAMPTPARSGLVPFAPIGPLLSRMGVTVRTDGSGP